MITIELLDEIGMWKASFESFHGYGFDPAEALLKLLEVLNG